MTDNLELVRFAAGFGWIRTMSDIDYMDLDPGIRNIVIKLQEAGFDTTDSGDGASKPAEWYESGEAMPFPHVVIKSDPDYMFAEADKLAVMLDSSWNIQASYDPRDGSAIILASQDNAERAKHTV